MLTINTAENEGRDVVGCCIDMDLRSIKFSLNGSFDSPMGIVFDNIDADIEYMYPAITINSSFGGCLLWWRNAWLDKIRPSTWLQVYF